MIDGQVVSLAEFTCWNGSDLRAVRKKIWFTLKSVGKIDGRRVSEEFQADFALMYDATNEYTIWLMNEVCPGIRWDRMFYWRRWDIQGIDVYDAGTENLVARLRVRSGGGKKTDAKIIGDRPVEIFGLSAVVIDFESAKRILRSNSRENDPNLSGEDLYD